MTIERLIIENYKTYTALDIDLSTKEKRPIILIGGANGGGKTTFFEAIRGALYGLNIVTERQFRELVNAANKQKLSKQKIILAIHFSRQNKEKIVNYQLKRTYLLYEGTVRESLELRVGNLPFQCGPHSSEQEQMTARKELHRVIQTNLPETLARYFLFDAMEAGNLLRQEKLQTVIRENIEQVMGFDRYLQLERATANAILNQKQQQIKQNANKKLYERWCWNKNAFIRKLEKEQKDLENAIQYTKEHLHTFEQLKNGKQQEETIKGRINNLDKALRQIEHKEKRYVESCDLFIQNLEAYIAFPLVSSNLTPLVQPILIKEKKRAITVLDKKNTATLVQKVIHFLQARKLLNQPVKAKTIVAHILKDAAPVQQAPFFTKREIDALQNFLQLPKVNLYSKIVQQQQELCETESFRAQHKKSMAYYQAQLSKEDFSLLQAYQEQEIRIRTHKENIKNLELDLKELETKMAAFEAEFLVAPDQKEKELQQFKTFFERFGLELLANKKEKIEAKMKLGLNQMLVAYKGMIDRVVLPQDLKNLTFKIFHKSGNEIYLNQLNTASKQIVIQCLLKALHDHGNYHPPVLIDTVMGVLDEESRGIMLAHFLPTLSHQTILLSSDSEIRKAVDFPKIAPFVTKTYTLKRNREAQQTTVMEGYFSIS